MCLCKLVMTHDSLLIVRFVFFPTLTVVGLPVLRKPRVAFQFTICLNKKSPRPLALPHPFKKLHSGPYAGPRRRLAGRAILPSSSSRHTGCFALPEPWPAWRTSSGQPVSACCSSFRQVFEPFLLPLSPERPRPAGTSTPSLLSCRHSPESFPSPALAGCHDRTRRTLRQFAKTPCIPGGAPIRSLFRHAPMTPTFRQRRGLSSTPE